MDPEITALAGSAGTTIVTLMASDAWQRTREGVVALWRRVHPDRATAIDADLETSRTDLLAARADGDEQSEEELRAEWQGRVRRLLAADPSVVQDLRRLLQEVSPSHSDGPGATDVRMRATASGHGRVYQAGRDQHITES